MRHLSYSVLLGLVSLLSTKTLAAWSSGGGELIKDAHNPWFIQNTAQVTYCILHDSAHFELHDELDRPLDTLIADAVNFWKAEFKTAYYPDERTGPERAVRVATQDFVRAPCDDNTDLRFQFGVLTAGQRAEMERLSIDPRELISAAIRTSYDKVQLKAQGFIYLAADSGDLRPRSEHMRATPWATRHGSVIFKILVHELGHVFGVQHKNVGPDVNFMSPDFPQAMVEGEIGGGVTSRLNDELNSFFSYRSKGRGFNGSISVSERDLAIRFFGIPSTAERYEWFYKDGILEVWGDKFEGKSNSWERIGFGGFNGTFPIEAHDREVTVWLPAEQQVYKEPLPDSLRHTLVGPMSRKISLKGTYHSLKTEESRQITVHLSPNSSENTISGILNGKLYMNIDMNR